MKVHISYETDEEKDAAMDVFDMLDERFPDKKKRFKEPKSTEGRKHAYYTIVDMKKADKPHK